MSHSIRPLACLQSAVFLLNSRMGHFTAPPGIALKDPFSRSYGAMLPSSLTRFLPRALVCLYPPTCVGFGTACRSVDCAFSWQRGHMDSRGRTPLPGLRCRLTPGGRTCPGKPWDSGDLDSHQVFRYSCPHNRQYEVHGRFRAPLQPVVLRSPTTGLAANPRIRHCVYSRSFSARGLSSSQLLRTV